MRADPPLARRVSQPRGPWPLALSALLITIAGAGVAVADPFVDGAFTPRSAINDPDLIVVRERYDPVSRRQALYFRVHVGSPARQVFSGEIIVRGASIVAAIGAQGDLIASDVEWALDGTDYGDPAARGLEFDERDVLRIANPGRARFSMENRDDIDDFRLIVQYPDEGQKATFDVELFHRRRPDPTGELPNTFQAGIHVGSLVDFVPDDGDYSEVFEVHEIKLLIEDFDIIERALFVGQVPEDGGRAGPAIFRVDNFADGVDYDLDNGFDQNGVITPIPTAVDIENLLVEQLPFEDERGNIIPVEAVTLRGLGARIADGEQLAVEVEVEVAPGTPQGVYVGRTILWEDNDRNGLRGVGEPSDTIRLSIVVGDPNAPFDLGVPDEGIGDLGPIDGTVDAELDMRPVDATLDAGVDARPIDLGRDDGPPVDMEIDAGSIDGPPVAVDLGDEGPPDIGDAADLGPSPGDAEATDVGADAADPDAERPDTTPDAADLGHARGGACSCALRADPGGAPDAVAALLLLLAAPIRGRRRGRR